MIPYRPEAVYSATDNFLECVDKQIKIVEINEPLYGGFFIIVKLYRKF